jgi:hypothetical protein
MEPIVQGDEYKGNGKNIKKVLMRLYIFCKYRAYRTFFCKYRTYRTFFPALQLRKKINYSIISFTPYTEDLSNHKPYH